MLTKAIKPLLTDQMEINELLQRGRTWMHTAPGTLAQSCPWCLPGGEGTGKGCRYLVKCLGWNWMVLEASSQPNHSGIP